MPVFVQMNNTSLRAMLGWFIVSRLKDTRTVPPYLGQLCPLITRWRTRRNKEVSFRRFVGLESVDLSVKPRLPSPLWNVSKWTPDELWSDLSAAMFLDRLSSSLISLASKTNVLSLEEEGRGRGGKIDNYTLTAIERVVIAGCSPFITVNS